MLVRSAPLRHCLFALSLLVPVSFATSDAQAALTTSEQVQLRNLYADADLDQADRFRSLLARTDHTPEDVEQAFESAVDGPRFDRQRQEFLDQVLFGPASDAARSDLAAPVLRGLLVRARKLETEGELDELAFRESLRIHRFALERLASSGSGAAGLRDDAVEKMIEHYRAHLKRASIAPDNLPPLALLVRRQADLTLAVLAEGRVPRSDVAKWLAIEGREKLFAEQGWLMFGNPSPASQPAFDVWTKTLLGAPARPAAIWYGAERPSGLVAPGGVVHVHADPRSQPAAAGKGNACLANPGIAQTALTLTLAVAQRRLAEDASFRARAAAAAEHAASERAFAEPELTKGLWETGQGKAPVSPWMMVGSAARRLLLDADATLAFALSESKAGRVGPAAQVHLAIDLLGGDETTLLGKCKDGAATVIATKAPTRTGDRVRSLKVGETTYGFELDKAGAVTAMVLGEPKSAPETDGDDDEPPNDD